MDTLIAQTIFKNLGCIEQATPLTAAQLINIKCNPPDNWSTIYNGPTCKLARELGNPCTYCYACCAEDINQENYVKISTSCGINIDTIRLVLSKTLQPSSYLLPLLNTITAENITKAIQQVQSIQSINITGVGIQQRVHQNIVLSVILANIRTDEFLMAISNYTRDINPPILDNTTDLLSTFTRLYTNSLMTALSANGACIQNVQISQITNINCNTPELIAANAIAAASNECAIALSKKVPHPELYCSVCSITDSEQNIISSFTAACNLTNPTRIANKLTMDWLRAPNNLYDVNNTNYVSLLNEIESELTDKFINNIYQQLIAAQNINVTYNNRHITGISQNGVYNVVLTAIQNSNIKDILDRLSMLINPVKTPVNSHKYIITIVIIALIIAVIILGTKYNRGDIMLRKN